MWNESDFSAKKLNVYENNPLTTTACIYTNILIEIW